MTYCCCCHSFFATFDVADNQSYIFNQQLKYFLQQFKYINFTYKGHLLHLLNKPQDIFIYLSLADKKLCLKFAISPAL